MTVGGMFELVGLHADVEFLFRVVGGGDLSMVN